MTADHATLRACGLVYRGLNDDGAEMWEGETMGEADEKSDAPSARPVHCPGCEDPSLYAARGCPGLISEAAKPVRATWRTGRTVGETLYCGDVFIGSCTSGDWARILVTAANAAVPRPAEATPVQMGVPMDALQVISADRDHWKREAAGLADTLREVERLLGPGAGTAPYRVGVLVEQRDHYRKQWFAECATKEQRRERDRNDGGVQPVAGPVGAQVSVEGAAPSRSTDKASVEEHLGCVSGGGPTCIYLKDGSKIRIEREGERAWLRHVQQDEIGVCEKKP